MAYLANPDNPNGQTDANDVQTAAAGLRLQVHLLKANIPSDIDLAFTTIAREQLGGAVVANDPFLNGRVNQVVQLALTQRVPTVFPRRDAVQVGGLVSYGSSPIEAGRAMGVYTGRVLKGENPGDLPIVQAAKFEFVINLITAKSLGLTLPPGLLAIADEVIE